MLIRRFVKLTAFDGGRGGQRRIGNLSVNGSGKMLISFIFGVTPNRRQKILSNPEDGLVSRFMFVSMDPTPGRRKPKYGNLTQKEMDELNTMVDELWRVGLKPEEEIAELERRLMDKNEIVPSSEQIIRDLIYVNMPKLEKMIAEFEETRLTDFALTGSISADTYSHRIPQMMRRMGMILYWLYGQKETNDLVTLVKWAGERELQELLNRYGNAYDDIYLNNEKVNQTYQRNGHNVECIKSLPLVISREDIRQYRKSHGLTSNNDEENCITVMINRLVQKNLIVKTGDDTWEKVTLH